MDLILVKAFFLKYLLLPIILIILLLVLVYIKKKLSFIKMKNLILYLLIMGILLALPGLLGFAGNTFNPYWYLLATIYYLIFGVIHVNQLFDRFYDKNTAALLQNVFQVILTFACMLLATYLFVFLFDWLSPYQGYAFISATCVLSFCIPLFFYFSYIQFLKIPFSIYKTWTYNSNLTVTDFEGIDFNKLMVINIELTKKISDGNRFLIKAKTLPKDLSFGEWFHKLIDDYNYKNGSSPIQLVDEQDNPHSWVFYTKRSFFHFRKYIDFEVDMQLNKIKENDVIICKRVVEYKIN